jgi:hypothetical protein
MMKFDFREPLLVDDSGLYITGAQMQFWLNTPGNEALFKSASPVFIEYYKKCALYNLAYDKSEVTKDCWLVWDDKTDNLAWEFKAKSGVFEEYMAASDFLSDADLDFDDVEIEEPEEIQDTEEDEEDDKEEDLFSE